MTQPAPQSAYRKREGLGVWEHKGKVAAVGIGHSDTARRWDGTAANSIGAFAIDALRKAMADAGVSPDQVDGLVIDPGTTTGAHWDDQPLPWDVIQAYNQTDDPLDGIAKLSAEWLIANMPELTNVKFTRYGPGCMSNAIVVAAQAVGDGETHTCLVLKGWHNLAGRYYQGGAAAQDTVSGPGVWGQMWGTRAGTVDAWTFQEYLTKYNKSHDLMAPFVVNSKRNGLLFPEGFFAQHRPDAITVEDYLAARWIVKPLNLFDMDIPIMAAAAYLFTTPERAKDMAQKPVYILNHCTTRPKFGLAQGLDNAQASTDSTGRKLYEGSGLTPADLDLENMYDGFTTFHPYFVEGLRYRGMGRGDFLDFVQGDISLEGPNPISISGGNSGSGRTRFWMHTDSIQQIQGRAGARQAHLKNGRPDTVISGGPMPQGGDFTVWASSPD